jgi:hypothetical protein
MEKFTIKAVAGVKDPLVHQVLITTPNIKQIEFSLEVMPENIPIEDNLHTREIQKEIKEQLNQDNLWAWCSVKITGTYKVLSAYSCLGCCSYKDLNDFMSSGYAADMQQEILQDIRNQIVSLSVQFD